MALFSFDLKKEAAQLKGALSDVVRDELNPAIKNSILQAEDALARVVTDTSKQLDDKIDKIAVELQNQRTLTKQDVELLIDYAAIKFSESIDERISNLRQQVSELVDSKSLQLKEELENAAARSRKQLWINAAVAVGASVVIAIVAVAYRKLSNNEIDLFFTFRIIFMSMTVGSLALLIVKLWRHYGKTDKGSKNLILIATRYANMLKPGGTAGIFALTVVFAVVWALLQFYQAQLLKLLP